MDEDGWGIEDSTFESCACPDGYATRAGDCDDADTTIHPGAAETWYDGVDQDCAVDDDFDADEDGWHVDNDCADDEAAVNPDAEEICGNGIDDDCDGLPGACGIDAEWDVTDARLEILSMNTEARVSPLGTVADVDGDGQPELAMGWWTVFDQGCGEGETFFEVHVASLAAAGTEAVGDRGLARLVAPVDCWAWTAAGSASGEHDLDDDGFADLLVAVSNTALADTTVASRVYLVDGPVLGEVDLARMDLAEQPLDWSSFGNVGMKVANAGLEGGPVVLVFSSYGSPAQSHVAFLSEDHFRAKRRVTDAPTLTSADGWEISGQSIADLDGDGIDDVVLLHGHDSLLPWAGSYIGPLDRDVEMEDASGEIRTEEVLSTTFLYDLVTCPAPSGGHQVYARTISEDADTYGHTGSSVLLRGWSWTETEQDLSDAEVQVLDDDDIAPMVSSCTGDLDADGVPELVLTSDDDIGEVDTSIIKFADMPDPGTWYIDDLVRGQVLAPTERAWSTYDDSPPLIGDIDFTGDGADDLVFGLGIQPASYEPEETGPTRTLLFPGSPAGL